VVSFTFHATEGSISKQFFESFFFFSLAKHTPYDHVFDDKWLIGHAKHNKKLYFSYTAVAVHHMSHVNIIPMVLLSCVDCFSLFILFSTNSRTCWPYVISSMPNSETAFLM